jgi:hypothetical protein
MKRFLGQPFATISQWMLAAVIFSSGLAVAHARVATAAALIEQIETQYQGNTSHGRMRMIIQTKQWKRTLVMESWSEGREKFLARILEPAKERGTSTLKVGDDIWNYLPKIDRLMKIPSSLMGDKWMGSHLTNDDLVKDSKIDKLYDFTILREDEQRAVIQGVPKAAAAVVWGRITYEVDLEKKVPIAVEYFDEDGKKMRVISFSDTVLEGKRWLARHMMIKPMDHPEESTEIRYEEIQFDIPLPAGAFSTQNLRKM